MEEGIIDPRKRKLELGDEDEFRRKRAKSPSGRPRTFQEINLQDQGLLPAKPGKSQENPQEEIRQRSIDPIESQKTPLTSPSPNILTDSLYGPHAFLFTTSGLPDEAITNAISDLVIHSEKLDRWEMLAEEGSQLLHEENLEMHEVQLKQLVWACKKAELGKLDLPESTVQLLQQRRNICKSEFIQIYMKSYEDDDSFTRYMNFSEISRKVDEIEKRWSELASSPVKDEQDIQDLYKQDIYNLTWNLGIAKSKNDDEDYRKKAAIFEIKLKYLKKMHPSLQRLYKQFGQLEPEIEKTNECSDESVDKFIHESNDYIEDNISKKQTTEIIEQAILLREQAYQATVVSAEQTLSQADQARIQYPDQINQYFSMHYERVAKSLQPVKEHLDNKTSHALSPESFMHLDDKDLVTLNNATTGLKKALTRTYFRAKYPTAQDIHETHNPPEESIQFFKGFQDRHWRVMAENRAKKENTEFTDAYYQQYLKDLAEKSRLSDGQPLWVGRSLDVFEAGLDNGCVLSSMEAITRPQLIRLGGYDPTTRFIEVATKLYGYTPEELSPEVYFIYMTIGKPDEQWGDVAIRAKQEVRQRASKVFYDSNVTTASTTSSSLYARPVLLDESGIDCFPLRGNKGYNDVDLEDRNLFDPIYLARHNIRDPLDFESIDDVKPWAEAHLHGGLGIGEIAEVHFFKPIEDENRKKKIKNQLDEYNIKYNL